MLLFVVLTWTRPSMTKQTKPGPCFSWVSAALAGTTATNGNANKVLFHCAAGGSRSAAVLLGFLLSTHPHPYDGMLRDALAAAKAKRPIVDPNFGFLEQLDQLERRIIIDRGLENDDVVAATAGGCLLYTSPSPRDRG